MVQIIEQSLPYGKLAENFGRNLGESFGQEVGRQTTARGVQSLVKQLGQIERPVSQLELMGALMQVPGMTQESMQMYIPAIQDALSMQAAQRAYSGGVGLGEEGGAPIAEQGQPVGISGATQERGAAKGVSPAAVAPANDPNTLVTVEQSEALRQPEPVITPDSIRNRAVELQREKPGLYTKFSDYEALATRELTAGLQKFKNLQSAGKANQQLEDSARGAFEKTLADRLQVARLGEAWSTLPGTAQRNYADAVIRNMNAGMSQETAINAVTKDALADVRKIGEFMELSGRPVGGRGEEAMQKLLPYRDVYEKLDILPEYKQELEGKGFGEYMAASAAYPMSTENRKKLAKLQGEAKQQSNWRKYVPVNLPFIGGAKMAESMLNELSGGPQKTEETIQWTNKNIDTLKPDESLYTWAMAVNDAGFDDQAFYDVVQQKVDSGELELSTHQEQELMRRPPVVPTLLDIYDASLGQAGKNKGKYGFWEQITRRYGGKR